MDDNIILTISENVSADNLPVFYKYRYTFMPNTEIPKQIDIMKLFVKFIRTHYAINDKIVAGIEHYTKGMLPTKPHVHIHFVSKTKADTIRKGLAKHWPELFIGKCQSCKAEVLVDEPKYWRYPCKQQRGDTKVAGLISGFSDDEKNVMVETAYACWKQSAEITIGKLQKKEERSSRDRLFVYLETQLSSLSSLSDVYKAAYLYYAEYETILNVETINGYINIWLLKNNKMSIDEFFKYHNPKFIDRNI